MFSATFLLNFCARRVVRAIRNSITNSSQITNKCHQHHSSAVASNTKENQESAGRELLRTDSEIVDLEDRELDIRFVNASRRINVTSVDVILVPTVELFFPSEDSFTMESESESRQSLAEDSEDSIDVVGPPVSQTVYLPINVAYVEDTVQRNEGTVLLAITTSSFSCWNCVKQSVLFDHFSRNPDLSARLEQWLSATCSQAANEEVASVSTGHSDALQSELTEVGDVSPHSINAEGYLTDTNVSEASTEINLNEPLNGNEAWEAFEFMTKWEEEQRARGMAEERN